MTTNTNYEYINEESISERLKCSVCRRPFINPVSTNCNDKKHTFCRECIEEWIKRYSSCPICRQQLFSEDVTPITDGITMDMLDDLKIKCQLCQQAELERGNFNDHINKVCAKVNVSCPSADIKCPWTGSRDQLDKHLSTCSFHPVRPWITPFLEQINEQQTKIERVRNKNEQLEEEVNQQQIHIRSLEGERIQLKRQIEQLENAERKRKKVDSCGGNACHICGKCCDWYIGEGYGSLGINNWHRRNVYKCRRAPRGHHDSRRLGAHNPNHLCDCRRNDSSDDS